MSRAIGPRPWAYLLHGGAAKGGDVHQDTSGNISSLSVVIFQNLLF